MAIDVGKGTEDVLLTKPGKGLQNAIQLVMPSMTQLIAKTIAEWKGKTLSIAGDTMAGEPWHKLVYQRSGNQPNSVIMTKDAAMSLRYDLDQVREKGISIVESIEKPDLELSDIGWDRLEAVMSKSGIDHEEIEFVLICCQEHGNPTGNVPIKEFRMKSVYGEQFHWNSKLLQGNAIPSYFPRLRSISSSVVKRWGIARDKVFVMDSAAAVLLGAANPLERELIVNVGNGHVSCIGHRYGKVEFVYEHHTGKFDQQLFENHIEKIYAGKLSHSEIIEEGGHGFVSYANKIEQYDSISVLGPNWIKLAEAATKVATPITNMMMAGPFGLLRALAMKFS